MKLKNVITLSTILSISIGIMISSCNSSNEKVVTINEGVENANTELKNVKEAYLIEIAEYKKETARKIDENNSDIAQFNYEIKNDKKEIKKDYIKEIAELKKRNNELQIKMDNYKEDGNDKWKEFKNEFDHDMDELGASIKALGKNNFQ